MTSDIETISKSIDSNPLGRLMHGQRELFHSNLLAWFFDAMPDTADRVFSPMGRAGLGSARLVERERDNLDLVMRWPGRIPLVIENKVFAIPARAQLESYSSKVTHWPESPARVLLAPAAPGFALEDWTFVSFRNLSDAILTSLQASDSSYEAETMRRYAILASDLEDLVSAVEVKSDDEDVWLPDSLLRPISSSQMRAALQKARASRVASLINKAVLGLEQPAGSGMTRATPLVEAFEYVYTGTMHVHLGWQLQGQQFRRTAIYHDEAIRGRDQASRRVREQVSAEHPEFFNFPAALPNVRGGRSDYNHFAPDSVYQYVKVERLAIHDLIAIAQSIHLDVSQLRSADEVQRPATAVRVAP